MIINFLGDTSFTGVFREKILNNQDIFNNELKKKLQQSDFNVVNFEGVAIKHQYDYKNDVFSPVESIRYLIQHNISIFNLANNHILDFCETGLLNTVKEIKKYNGMYFGAGINLNEASKIIYLEKNDIKVSLIGIGAKGKNNCKKGVVFDDNNITLIKNKISEARRKSDWVVLNFHNGVEYSLFPVDYIRNKLRRFIKMGVDIIIAHHPHVPQGMEKYDNGLIFYSLGNFVFDLYGHRKKKYTDLSLMVTIKFNKNKFDYDYVITKMDKNFGIVATEKNNTLISELSNKYMSDKFEKYRFYDALRTVFFNPVFGNSWKSNVLYPLLLYIRFKNSCKGNNLSLIKIICDYLKIDKIYKKYLKYDSLNEKNEY